MQKKYKATMALAVSALGCAGTLPISGTGFGWGLLHHGFLAATIGGLADWFAVTALFRKPLGISYRTEILRRNRQRIMDSIVEFSSDDLLSVDNVMGVLREQDMAQLMVDYLQNRGGRERLKGVVKEVALAAVNSMDANAVAAELSPAVREGVHSVALDRIFSEALQLMTEERYSRSLLHSLLDILGQVHKAPGVQQLLLENIHVLRAKYEKDSAGRAFVLASLDLTDERILQIFNEKISQYLEKMLQEDSAEYAELKAGAEMLLRALGKDADFREMLKCWQERFVNRLDFTLWLAQWLEQNIKGAQPFWLPFLEGFIDRKVDEFAEKKVWQRQFDKRVKEFVEEELGKHHDLVAALIRERLDGFSDDDLTEFVEAKVADDLQMIRINGSLVGAMVGMGLYILVWLTERMWGM